MQTILFEDSSRFALLPLTWTRPVFLLRIGIFTFQERWEKALGEKVHLAAYDYLQDRYNTGWENENSIWINGRFFPGAEIFHLLKDTEPNSYYLSTQDEIIVANFNPDLLPHDFTGCLDEDTAEEMGLRKINTSINGFAVRRLTDIFTLNHDAIINDVSLLDLPKERPEIKDPHTRIYGKDNIIVGEGVSVKAAIINAEDGPVYFGRKCQISEGAIIRGTHAIGEGTKVSMGAKLRGDSSFGPLCKVGGEIGNSVIMGYSNKGHEGYLGNSVLGYWCNLGADTNTSNLKNNYSSVRQWNYIVRDFVDTGVQFCGLVMGDHSKCGINTMFNTGTVVGVSANIYGGGFPPKLIPSFSWGGAESMVSYRLDKAMQTAHAVMQRRSQSLKPADKLIFEEVYKRTRDLRPWESELKKA